MKVRKHRLVSNRIDMYGDGGTSESTEGQCRHVSPSKDVTCNVISDVFFVATINSLHVYAVFHFAKAIVATFKFGEMAWI